MVKFIHTADIHLDSPLKGLEAHEDAPVEQIRGATRRAFDKLIDLAVEEGVDFILIAGDLFDGDWKDYNTGLFFADRMGQLSRAGIKVFIVSGNHDSASQITRAMSLPDNVTFFPAEKPWSVKLDHLGVIIHGQSYPTRAVSENLAVQYPQNDPLYFNIGLLHTSLTGREGHENYAPCSVDELKSKGYDFWALGHVHKREIVSQDPWIVFSGNIQGRHIRETGPRGATLIIVEDGSISSIEEQRLDVLTWAVCRVDLSECEIIDTIYDTVRKNLEQELDKADGTVVAVRLVLTGRCPVHTQLIDCREQWTEEFRSIAAGLGEVWLEKVEFQTRRKKNIKDISGSETPISGLMQSIQDLELNCETLLELVPELSVLKSKLPAELNNNEDFFLDMSKETISLLRFEVQELLLAKLIQHGGDK